MAFSLHAPVSPHLQPYTKTINMARACPFKTEGSLKSAYRRYTSLQPNSNVLSNVKQCMATMSGHASSALHNSKKCHSGVGKYTTCTTVHSSQGQRGYTEEITLCRTQPSKREGTRLESWGHYFPSWANHSQGIKALIFLISKMRISQGLEIIYVNCLVRGGYSNMCKEPPTPPVLPPSQ